MQNNKNLPILLILFFAVLIIGAILIQQNLSSRVLILEELRLPKKTIETLDETTLASWKTYQKDGFNFELKYPSSLTFKYDSVWKPESPLIKKTLNSVFEGESFDLTIVVNAPNASATTSRAELIREKAINIDGINTQNKIFREPNGDIISLVGFKKDPDFYYIWASIIDKKDANLRSFNQILSIFQFLE